MSTAAAERPSFLNLSQPAPEDRAHTALTAPVKTPTPELWNRLQNLRWADPKKNPPAGRYRQSAIARACDCDDGIVSLYANWQPGAKCPIDVPKFEAALSRWFAILDGAEAPEPEPAPADVSAWFHTSFTRGAMNFIASCASTGAVAAITSDAGSGKNVAAELFTAAFPRRSINIEAATFLSSGRSLMREIARHVGLRHRVKDNTPVVDRLVAHLISRKVCILVGNAQRLSRYSLAFLFDLHDRSHIKGKPGLSIVFLGNHEFIESMQANDQFRSRLDDKVNGDDWWGSDFRQEAVKGQPGAHRFVPVKSSPEATLSKACTLLTARELPNTDHAGVVPFLTKVAAVPGGGRLRLVSKLLNAAARTLAAGSDLTPLQALKSAYTRHPMPEEFRITL